VRTSSHPAVDAFCVTLIRAHSLPFVGRPATRLDPRVGFRQIGRVKSTAAIYSESVDEALVTNAKVLAKKMLAALPVRLAHVAGVARAAATQLAIVEIDELIAAAWLHDIGYARSIAFTGFHPLDGARYLQAVGYPDLVVSLVAFHSAATVEAEERGMLNELLEFALPPVDLLDALTFADMTTARDGSATSIDNRLIEVFERYRPGDAVFRAVTRSEPSLRDSVGRVLARKANG
jgi:predicted hydrolase (HD superfamily)